MELLDGDRYLNPKEEDIVLVDFGYKPTQEKISKYGKEMVLCNSDFLKHYPDWWSKDKTIMGIPACLTLAGIADNGKYLLYYFIDGDKAIIVYAYNNVTKEFDFFFVK